jgi:hypothetical protein
MISLARLFAFVLSCKCLCNVSTPSPLGDGQITPIILETHDLKGSND